MTKWVGSSEASLDEAVQAYGSHGGKLSDSRWPQEILLGLGSHNEVLSQGDLSLTSAQAAKRVVEDGKGSPTFFRQSLMHPMHDLVHCLDFVLEAKKAEQAESALYKNNLSIGWFYL